MKKLLFIPLLFITVSLSAFPIGEKKAREIATQFFAQTVTRGAAVNLELEWAGVDINAAMTRGAVGDVDEALMYIYNRADSKGFVIVSGDNSTRPIIAYSNEGDFEVAKLPDDVLTDILGYIEDTNGVLVEDAGASVVHFAMAFQFEGDAHAKRHVLYNCTATRPAVASATKAESIEPQTETITVTATSIFNASLQEEIVKASCTPTESTQYNAWLTTVYQPT